MRRLFHIMERMMHTMAMIIMNITVSMRLITVSLKMNKASLAALKDRLDLSAIQYVFTSHNGFTNDVQSAFRHIEVIPDLKTKGFLFDPTAPYDCFDERMSTK